MDGKIKVLHNHDKNKAIAKVNDDGSITFFESFTKEDRIAVIKYLIQSGVNVVTNGKQN